MSRKSKRERRGREDGTGAESQGATQDGANVMDETDGRTPSDAAPPSAMTANVDSAGAGADMPPNMHEATEARAAMGIVPTGAAAAPATASSDAAAPAVQSGEEQLRESVRVIADGQPVASDVRAAADAEERDIAKIDATEWPRRPMPPVNGIRPPRFQVVTKRSVLNAIHRHGLSSPGIEVCGVLVGNGYTDRAGPYLYVEACIRGDYASNNAAQVTFTAETWAHIQDEMEAHHPNQRIVGWYHTHPGFGIFLSKMDVFIHENFFNLPWQIAFVYDPQSSEQGSFIWRHGVPEREPFLTEEDADEDDSEPSLESTDPELGANVVTAALADVSIRLQKLERSRRVTRAMMMILLFLFILYPFVLFTIMQDRADRANRLPNSDYVPSLSAREGGIQSPALPLREPTTGAVANVAADLEIHNASGGAPPATTPGASGPGVLGPGASGPAAAVAAPVLMGVGPQNRIGPSTQTVPAGVPANPAPDGAAIATPSTTNPATLTLPPTAPAALSPVPAGPQPQWVRPRPGDSNGAKVLEPPAPPTGDTRPN